MIVRRAVGSDAGAIAGLHVRSWRAAYRGLIPDHALDGSSLADRRATWREEAEGRGEFGGLFVAEREGVLNGFCSVAEPSRDDGAGPEVAEIRALYVEPQAWRAGIGSALMQAALEHLRGWPEVTLWVLRENANAIAFYRRFGFAPDGAEKLYNRSGTTGVRLRRSRASSGTL